MFDKPQSIQIQKSAHNWQKGQKINGSRMSAGTTAGGQQQIFQMALHIHAFTLNPTYEFENPATGIQQYISLFQITTLQFLSYMNCYLIHFFLFSQVDDKHGICLNEK